MFNFLKIGFQTSEYMIYKKLGTTHLNVSVIGIGTWQFSGEWGKEFTQDEVNQILSAAESAGVNLIDTAECYGNHLSERLLGLFLKKNKNRDNWILATKFGHVYKGFLDVEDHWSAAEVKRQLENSLTALCTNHIDIYQFHSGTNDVFDNDELWQTLGKEKQAGKIRYLGISISEKMVLNDDLFQIQKAKERGIDIIQVRYNRLYRESEKFLIPECKKLKLGILVRQPLACGYLSGKYDSCSQFPKNDVRYWLNRDSFLEEMNLVRKLQENLGNNTNMAGWSVAWCLKNKNIGSVIVGCKNIAQLKDITDAIKIYAKTNRTV